MCYACLSLEISSKLGAPYKWDTDESRVRRAVQSEAREALHKGSYDVGGHVSGVEEEGRETEEAIAVLDKEDLLDGGRQ